jgi:hypothetical protein
LWHDDCFADGDKRGHRFDCQEALVSRCRSPFALAVLAAASMVLSGCRTEYIIDRASIADAEAEMARSGQAAAVPASTAAVAANMPAAVGAASCRASSAHRC